MYKVLFISHSNYFHGGEICLLESVQSLILNGNYKVHVAVPSNDETKLVIELKKSNAIVHLGITNQYWVGGLTKRNRLKVQRVLDTIQGFFLAIILILKVRPKFIIINTFVNNPVFAFASRIFNCKTIWYIHELVDADHGWHFYLGKKFSYDLIKFLSHKVLFNSYCTLNHFADEKELQNPKIHLLDYAVTFTINESIVKNNLERNFDELASPIKFLVAGRAVPGKGQEDIVRAFAILINEKGIKNIYLILLGADKNQYRDELVQITKDAAIENYIDFLPFTSEPENYFCEATFGITTSRNESFGRITVEYMKYGLVTIGAKAGATAEIIEDGVTGFFYEVKNAKDLADKIEEILKNKQIFKSIVLNAAAYANKKHNLERHGNNLDKILQSI